MSGNTHPTKRCDTCEFWAPGDQRRYRVERHPDDRTGGCRRNAPRPTVGGFEFEILKHLSTIAWAHASDEEKQEDFENWEEAPLHTAAWPSTHGHDWCGEWELRTSQTRGIGYPPNEPELDKLLLEGKQL